MMNQQKKDAIHFHTARFETSFGSAEQFFASDLPEVVLAGRSNVGKSSLINKLCNQKSLARVSATPGKTETINVYRLNQLRLVDLPGYGYAKRAKTRLEDWGDLMDKYFTTGRDIRLVLLLWDIRHDPSELDMVMHDFLEQTGLPFMIILTKADKLTKSELLQVDSRFSRFSGQPRHIVSANGMGIEELREIIRKAVMKEE